MSKPTSREYELSGIILSQDRQIAALQATIELLRKELQQLYDANQYLINQINSDNQ